MKIYKFDRTLIIFFLIGLILFTVLNVLWFSVYSFDRTPIMAIDFLFVLNVLIAFFSTKRVPLSGAMLIGVNILIVLLGFGLIKGFITG